ncbi:MAG TPA: cation:proton antiporter [Longimicrobiales bacterium]|nr:cation:proton antiporter [Longimicrobiales bacterium]
MPAIPRVLTLAALLGFGVILRDGLRLLPGNASTATIALGFLLLSAVVAGRIAAGVGLPRITGYIILGLLVGPDVLGIVSEENVAGLKLIDDIAISLIALSAGGELRVRELRARGRSMGGIMLAEMIMVFAVIAGGVVLVADLLPITQGRPLSSVLVIALVFGSIAIANSPSVAIAVINDTGSRGPVSSTILGVTVLKDVFVILLFAIALAVARTALTPGSSFETEFFFGLGMEIGGSLLAGVISGVIIAALLKTVRAHVVLFALAIAFVNAYMANLLHLEVLLLSLVAGFFLENISPVHGDPFVRALERNSLPVYALFFALAGAGLHLSELAALWPFVAAFVLARAGAVFAGTWIGARVTGAEPEVRRYAWLGFISQAGVTLGMVVIAARTFPEWGAELQTLFVAMVAIHELIGPVLLQKGLERAGEVGKREEAERAAVSPRAGAPQPESAAV